MKFINTIAIVLLLSFSFNAAAQKAEVKTYLQDKPAIMVNADSAIFIVKLKSNPTTGYSWFLREYDSNLLAPIKHEVEASTDKNLVGASGYELWTFKVKPAGFVVPQQTLIRFTYLRPWDVADSTQILFKVTTFPGVVKDKK